ncbi:MAG TPA: disulfide bond formation protein B [Rhodocyclaceae bacterium]
MNKPALNARAPFAAAAAVSIGLVVVGVILSRMLNLAACPLCILQRMVYLLVAAVGLLGLLAARPAPRRIAALAMAAAAATGAFVAGYQVWIQNFARDTNCVAATPWWEQMVDWASERLPLLFQVSGLCSEPGWKLLGVTIAEWSLLAFVALAGVSLFAAFRRY